MKRLALALTLLTTLLLGQAAAAATPISSGPSVSGWSDGPVDVFARGPNNELLHKHRGYGGEWSDWKNLGGVLTSDPDSDHNYGLHVVARGADNAAYYKTFILGQWSDWERLGGNLTSGPSVSAWSDGPVDVFARGPNNELLHKHRGYGGDWSDWKNLGGVLTSDPDSDHNYGLHVVARGADNAAYYKTFILGQWSDWERLGGNLTSGPSVSAWSDGPVDVFARGPNNELLHKHRGYGGDWSDWKNLGGVLTSGPDSDHNYGLHVVARCGSGALYHTWFELGSWHSSEGACRTVVHASQFTADPAQNGQLIAREWVDTLDGSARHEEPGWLATRGIVPCSESDPSGPRCGEVRERTTDSDADPTQADTYYVQRGLSVDDPNLKNVADLLETSPSVGSADARGPLGQALQAWQVPPPLHGDEYLRFTANDVLSTGDAADGVDGEQPEPTGLDVKTIVWVDEATQLPLKLRTERLDGTLLDESYWTYHPSRIDAASLPSDFFLAPRPVNVEQDEEVIAQSSDLMSTARAGELTGLGFEPYFLGESFTAAQGRFCLARLAVIRLQEPPENPAVSGGAEAGVNPSGRTVMVNAAYNAIEASERCRAHRGPLTAPDLEVNAAASTGATAAAWRSGYRRHGVAAPRSGPPPAFDPSLGPAALDADPRTIRLVALNARSSAVLGEKGRTTVSIVGPHERAMPNQLANLLERLEVSR